MSYTQVFSAQQHFISATVVRVEIDVTRGLYNFTVVGMASKSVDEARDRVSSAIKNTGFQSMKARHERVVVSLSPALLVKSGTFYDLAIAIGYLLSIGVVSFDPQSKLFVGELSLDGKVLEIPGVLAIVQHAYEQGFEEIFIPYDNYKEASLIQGITIYPVAHLLDLVNHFRNTQKLLPVIDSSFEISCNNIESSYSFAFDTIVGQEFAKRGLLIAAVGGHHLCLYGPPGTGKTMLAKAFQEILPDLSYDEMIQVTNIHNSVHTAVSEGLITRPPFRSPHHSASYAAIVGGGPYLKPGEITLAHCGVLFLDEFPEFDRRVIESLRQPLEDGYINITRSLGSVQYPANFILLATMNPCPCGYYGTDVRTCVCTPYQILQYRKKISGPIIDRIHLWIRVPHVSYDDFGLHLQTQDSKSVTENTFIRENLFSSMSFRKKRMSSVPQSNFLSDKAKDALVSIGKRLNLSPRSLTRVTHVARTIADIEQSDNILEVHILEAVQYRQFTL